MSKNAILGSMMTIAAFLDRSQFVGSLWKEKLALVALVLVN